MVLVGGVCCRPENIALCNEDTAHISGTVAVCEYLGSEQFAYIDCGFDNMVTARVNPDAELEVGSITGLSFDNEKLYILMVTAPVSINPPDNYHRPPPVPTYIFSITLKDQVFIWTQTFES